MTVKVADRAPQRVLCPCMAVLTYNPEDVRRSSPHIGILAPSACISGGWPWIMCPECYRAVLVPGCR